MPAVTTEPAAAAASSSQTPTDGSDDFTRLHITPLDTELFKVIVPASALPRARNISFHTVETFPEKRYGFVELPKTDADKIKAKLNGAVLKGSKIRIEKARPAKTFEPVEMDEPTKKSKKEKKSSKDQAEGSKKRKRDDNVVDGVALTDRKVKRGWTETPTESAKRKKKDRSDKKESKEEKKEKKKKEKQVKKRTKSKYTEQEECLLKVKLPPTAVSNIPKDDVSHKKRKKNKGVAEVTVHEFEKTTKFPSFLKDTGAASSGPVASEYVEGKGWVDEEGNLVEAVKEKRPKKAEKPALKKKKPAPVEEDSDDTSSSGTSSEDESESEFEDEAEQPTKEEVKAKKVVEPAAAEDDSDTSSSGSSSDEEEDEQPAHNSVEATTSAAADEPTLAEPASSPTSRNLKIKIPPPATPSADKVHPLEALYKRRKAGDKTAETPEPQAEPFTFFGGGDDEDNEDNGDGVNAPPMPMTPFTSQDFEWRNVRSAAPTPDTAHPSRMQNFWAPRENDEDMEDLEDLEEEEEEEENEQGEGSGEGNKAATDFQSWFWENRRDLNQSWMKRRKAAAKEKRHRENKARGSRAV